MSRLLLDLVISVAGFSAWKRGLLFECIARCTLLNELQSELGWAITLLLGTLTTASVLQLLTPHREVIPVAFLFAID